MEESQKRKKEEQKGKESPFGSHEILRLATDPGETMEAESILRADGHRCLADWHRSDRSIWRSRSSGSREIARPRKSRPPPFFRSSSSRKPLTLVLGLVQFVAFPGPAVFRCLREGKNEVRPPSSFSKSSIQVSVEDRNGRNMSSAGKMLLETVRVMRHSLAPRFWRFRISRFSFALLSRRSHCL